MSKRIMNFLKNMRKSFTENPRGGLAYSNSSGRSLNRYNNAHKTRKDYVLAPACLAKLHRDAILPSREGLSQICSSDFAHGCLGFVTQNKNTRSKTRQDIFLLYFFPIAFWLS